jgi:hypothetical protein
MKRLTQDQVLQMHNLVIQQYGGSWVAQNMFLSIYKLNLSV